MMRCGTILNLILIVVLLSTQGCGSSSSGGASDFKTVTATATVDSSKNPLLADLATWTGTPCGATSTFSVVNDVVNFNIVSNKTTSSGTASPLMLQKATITFSPADTGTPPLSAQFTPAYQSLIGYTVPGAGTLSVPVEVVPHLLKESFGSALVCTGSMAIYNYNVEVVFDVVEQGTGKSESIKAGMTVRFADFAD